MKTNFDEIVGFRSEFYGSELIQDSNFFFYQIIKFILTPRRSHHGIAFFSKHLGKATTLARASASYHRNFALVDIANDSTKSKHDGIIY